MFRDLMTRAVAGGAERTAVIDDLGPLTYRELDTWSAAVADELSGLRGAGPSPRSVMLLLPNGAAWLAAYLAVLRAGMPGVPLNWVLTEAEVGHALEQTLPAVVLTAPQRVDAVRALCARYTGDGPRVRVRPVPVEHRPDLSARAGGGVPAPGRSPYGTGPLDPCLLMHTSGTTGSRRAVVQTEQALHLGAGYWRACFRRGGDVVAAPLPVAHTYGHLVVASTLLAHGTVLLTARRFDATGWLSAIVGHRATVLEGVPSVFARLLEAGIGERTSLRSCMTGGQPVPVALCEKWSAAVGVPLRVTWGMTELAGPGLAPLDDSCPDSVGVPVPGLETRVVDPATDAEAAPGDTGELLVRGAQVTPGHHVGGGRTAGITDGAGWLHTGDLATRDEHGCHRIVGRSKDTIMAGGYSVAPAEVEEVLRAHPGVRDAVVVGRPDSRFGEAVHAVVVAGAGARPDAERLAERLIGHCRTLLAHYKVPRGVTVVQALPLNASGKVDRAALAQMLAEERP